MKNIAEIVNSKKRGEIARISYKTAVNVCASAKKAGIHIDAIVSTTAQFNVNYSNIKRVIAKRAERANAGNPVDTSRDSWWEWKDGSERRIAVHKTNGTEYVAYYPLPSRSNTVVTYEMNGKPVDIDTVKQYAIPSYFSAKPESEIKFVIKDNVISVSEKEAK